MISTAVDAGIPTPRASRGLPARRQSVLRPDETPRRTNGEVAWKAYAAHTLSRLTRTIWRHGHGAITAFSWILVRATGDTPCTPRERARRGSRSVSTPAGRTC